HSYVLHRRQERTAIRTEAPAALLADKRQTLFYREVRNPGRQAEAQVSTGINIDRGDIHVAQRIGRESFHARTAGSFLWERRIRSAARTLQQHLHHHICRIDIRERINTEVRYDLSGRNILLSTSSILELRADDSDVITHFEWHFGIRILGEWVVQCRRRARDVHGVDHHQIARRIAG